MKKKIVMLMLSMALVATAVAGCGTTASNTSETTETTSTQSATENASIDLTTDWTAKETITLGDSISVDGSGATVDGNTVTITDGGAYTITGESDDVNILVDSEDDVKIILNGVTMTSTTGPVIYGENANSLYIETAEGTENVLADSSNYETDSDGSYIGKATISSKDDLILLGSGTLTVTGNFKHCIAGNDSLYVEGGTYQLTANVTDGIHANDLLVIDSGDLTITAASDLLESEADLTINGGSITGTSQDEGIESKANMTIAGGTIDIEVQDDGLNASTSISITGGDLTIHASAGDAIDSNGSLTIEDGNIVAYGGSAPEGALDCDQAQIVINGGTVIAVGDANSEISTDSKQVSVLLGQYSAGDEISITTEDGTEVMSFTLEEARSNIVVSTDGLTSGETYKVLVNGTEDQSFSVDSQVVSAGGTANSMGGGQGGMGGGGQMPDMNGGDGQMPNMGESDGTKPELPSGEAPSGTDGERPEMPSGGQMPGQNNNTESSESDSSSTTL